MKFSEYINNPMGVKNAVFSMREMYRNVYRQKLDNILARELGKIEYTLYKDKDRYLFHFKIPSEVVYKFYYDVVVEFFSKDKTVLNEKNLNNYDIRFYSNDPYFIYTFAYVFNKNNMFIKDLESKVSKYTLSTKAMMRNPYNQVGYVKSIYFTYLIMNKYSLFDKDKIDMEIKKYDKKELLSNVMEADKKIELRKEKAPKKNKDKINHDKQNKNENNTSKKSNIVNKTKTTNTVKRTNVVKTSKKK